MDALPSDGWHLYALLEVDPWAKPREVEQARLRMIARYAGWPSAERDEQISIVNIAYQIIANPRLRRAYDAGGAIPCPYCDHPMPRAIADWQHIRLHSGVGTPDPDACRVCHRKPTATFSFRAVNREPEPGRARSSPFVFEGPLCRVCSFSVQRGYQEANYRARRPGELAAAFRYLIRNKGQSVRRRGLVAPSAGPSSPSPRREFWLQLIGGIAVLGTVLLLVLGALLAEYSDHMLPPLIAWAGAACLFVAGVWLRRRSGIR